MQALARKGTAVDIRWGACIASCLRRDKHPLGNVTIAPKAAFPIPDSGERLRHFPLPFFLMHRFAALHAAFCIVRLFSVRWHGPERCPTVTPSRRVLEPIVLYPAHSTNGGRSLKGGFGGQPLSMPLQKLTFRLPYHVIRAFQKFRDELQYLNVVSPAFLPFATATRALN